MVFFLRLFILIFIFGCSTYQTKVKESRQLIKSGQIDQALQRFKPLAEAVSDDQLVYLMDYGTSLQISGRYKESNDIFLKADKLSELVDYHSVSNIALATVGSEEMLQYKGDSYEKILINTYLATNYLMLNQFDEALVEVRRIIEKINKFRLDGRKDYEQNPFAHYLAGLIWEADHKYDDAYIAYEDSYKLDSSNPHIKEDLLRLSKKSHREESYKKWKSQFPEIFEKPDWYKKNNGELIVLIQQGWGPEKNFSSIDIRYPQLYPVYSETTFVDYDITGKTLSEKGFSRSIYDIEKVAIKTLQDDVGWMILRKVSASIGKAVVADQIRQKDKALGDLAWIVMRLSDRADLRQWSTLPRTFQIVRIWLPAGEYKLNLQGRSESGVFTADRAEFEKVIIKPDQKTFMHWRPLR